MLTVVTFLIAVTKICENNLKREITYSAHGFRAVSSSCGEGVAEQSRAVHIMVARKQ
jgi:hypothetical protein